MPSVDPKTLKEHLEFFNIDLSSGWEQIAPGIETKILAGRLDDAEQKGHMTRLSRWEPLAEINEVREHRFYEEVFVVAGTFYVASQDPPHGYEAFHAYSFATRPPHAKHGPFRAGEEGCVLLETFFYL